MGGVGVVWVGDGGGDGDVKKASEKSIPNEMDTPRSLWQVAVFLIVSGILGFISGSLIGFIPGFIAFRTDPGRVLLWMRFDQFLAIMALSSGLATLAIYRWVVRDTRISVSLAAPIIGASPWVFISMASDGEGSFRVGGALAGLVASVAATVAFMLVRRSVLRPRIGADEKA